MPEIAEVETVRNVLKKKVLNKKIIDVKIRYNKILEVDTDVFKNILIGRSIKDIKRRGKWLIFDLGDYYLLSHLRMEGKYFIKDHLDEYNKHEHIIICFDDATDLRYHDTRKFGRMNIIPKDKLSDCREMKSQGYEPNEKELTKEYLFNSFKNKKLPIKSVLLDQSIISGLGNIYADEVLFASKINPLRKAYTLSLDECNNIVTSSGKIIKKAMAEGGTTIKSYTSSLGVTGNYQNFLCVHKKENEPCLICSKPIKKTKIGGRSTYYCENCQK